MEQAFFAFPFDFGVGYRIVVSRACQDLKLTPVFGDEIRKSEHLTDKMRDAIEGCGLGFYDITGFNPNVMIELGIAISARKKYFVMFNENRHLISPAVRAFKDPVPADISSRERFVYRDEYDLDRELRKVLRQTLGIGRNSHYELKMKITGLLRQKPLPRKKINESLSPAAEQDVSAALAALKLEKVVESRGSGLGAVWVLCPH